MTRTTSAAGIALIKEFEAVHFFSGKWHNGDNGEDF